MARIIKKTEARERKLKGESEMKPEWMSFIDEYMANGGNATQAYHKIYKNSTGESARRLGSLLLTNIDIRKEIDYRFRRRKITDDAVFGELWEVGTKYRGAKTLMPAVKALEVVAKMKGMLVETKRIEFGRDNPAYVPPVVRPESTKLLRKVEQIEVLEGVGVVIE